MIKGSRDSHGRSHRTMQENRNRRCVIINRSLSATKEKSFGVSRRAICQMVKIIAQYMRDRSPSWPTSQFSQFSRKISMRFMKWVVSSNSTTTYSTVLGLTTENVCAETGLRAKSTLKLYLSVKNHIPTSNPSKISSCFFVVRVVLIKHHLYSRNCRRLFRKVANRGVQHGQTIQF